MAVLKHKKSTGDFKKILVRALNWTIGDTLMTFPFIGALKKQFPGAIIDIAVPGRISRLYEGIAGFNLIKIGSESIMFGDKIKFLFAARRGEYDAGFALQRAFEPALMFLLAGIRYRFGYNSDYRGFLLTNSLSEKNWSMKTARMHQSDYFLDLLDAFFPLQKNYREYGISPAEKESEVNSLVSKAGFSLEKYILLCPGTSYGTARYWPEKNWILLAEKLRELYPEKTLVFTGAKYDKEVISRIRQNISFKHFDLSGTLSLGELISLVKRADLLITCDNGTAHLRNALGGKYIVLFGSTNPNFTGPSGKNGRLLYMNAPCSPCFARICPLGTMECMNKITVSSVTDEIQKLSSEI